MNLSRPASNREETRAFLEAHHSGFHLPDYVVPSGYILVANSPKTTADGVVQSICLISTSGPQPETVYKVKKIVRDCPNAYLPIENCTQLIVWRQFDGVHSDVLSRFARQVFNFLLQSHNIMITDEEQTDDGRRFWLNRISESFSMSDRNVYYIDLNNVDDQLVPIVERIRDNEEMMDEYYEKGWGNNEDHKNRAFLISKLNLS
ncbi:hypothetical protein [Vibrio marisflavi]|uniref:Uncharacterized protein n=1 Tax=Vibrio marisflavi CECT 7928 TaxID=634439 RepID=A0ABN8EBE6_9VIBR|nr:hypothetical protein [Vibrio marisflavi]CAH0542991.1 hypothetical protein VMF7928_04349 [Vibrio marisflavi CECT 7928]